MILPPGYAAASTTAFPRRPFPDNADITSVTEIMPAHLRISVSSATDGEAAYWIQSPLTDGTANRQTVTKPAHQDIMAALTRVQSTQHLFLSLEREFRLLLAAAATSGAGVPVDLLTPHKGVAVVFSVLKGHLVAVCCAPDGMSRLTFRVDGDPDDSATTIEWDVEISNAAASEIHPGGCGEWAVRDIWRGHVPERLGLAVALLAAPLVALP